MEVHIIMKVEFIDYHFMVISHNLSTKELIRLIKYKETNKKLETRLAAYIYIVDRGEICKPEVHI